MLPKEQYVKLSITLSGQLTAVKALKISFRIFFIINQ